MPTARSELAVAELDGRLFAAGGIGWLGTTSAFEIYDPDNDTWKKARALPEALHHLALASAGRYVYASGGYRSLQFKPEVQALWRYDPRDDTWRRLADMPFPRAAHTMVAVDGKLFVFGGVGSQADAVLTYNPDEDLWRQARTPMPNPREHLVGVAVGRAVYVIGGRQSGTENVAMVEIFSTVEENWRSARPLRVARSGFAAALLRGKIHVVGGEAFDPERTFDSQESLNVAADVWSPGPSMPLSAHGIASTVVGTNWYVVGGATRAGLGTLVSISNTVQIYSTVP